MQTVHQGSTTRVICVGNQKGGVGKTTNTINLAAALVERGRTSLIIDLDPSASATKNLGAPTTGWVNAFDLLTGTEPEDCILTPEDDGITLPRGIHLVPGTETLGTLGQWLAQPQNVFKPLPALLVEPIRTLRGRYDYIWFDTPPTHAQQMTSALTVADYAIVSTKPEARSVDAIGPAVQYIARAKQQANPKLRLLGIILNAMPGRMTRLASLLVEEVEKSAVGLEFRPYLKSRVALQEAEKAAQTIFDYEPSGKTADQYRELAKQVEERIERFETEAAGLATREIMPAARPEEVIATEGVVNG